jgi:hypothetical protein
MIVHSESESEIFSNKIGRITIQEDFDDWTGLKDDFINTNYDFLRIKIINPKSDLYENISTVSKRYYHLDIITLFKINVKEHCAKEVLDDNLTFSIVTYDNQTIFKNIFDETYEISALGYFRHPDLDNVFSIDLQKKNITNYIFTNFLGQNPENVSVIIYYHDIPVGCIVIQLSLQGSYTYFVGLLENFRGRGLHNSVVAFIHRLTLEKNITWVYGGARINNLSTHYAAKKNGMKSCGHEWVFLLRK